VEAIVPHRRPDKKGSFGGHLEELVSQFPHELDTQGKVQEKPQVDRLRLKEKIDIHALLFQMAWQVERGERES
jgi:hypothetical protein